jgi:hypothetical protein
MARSAHGNQMLQADMDNAQPRFVKRGSSEGFQEEYMRQLAEARRQSGNVKQSGNVREYPRGFQDAQMRQLVQVEEDEAPRSTSSSSDAPSAANSSDVGEWQINRASERMSTNGTVSTTDTDGTVRNGTSTADKNKVRVGGMSVSKGKADKALLMQFLFENGFVGVTKPRSRVTMRGFRRVYPLHVAAKCGDHHMVAILLRHGADPMKENSKKQLPLEVARKKNYNHSHSKVIELLAPYFRIGRENTRF